MADVLRIDKISLYQMGRQYSIAKCIELYGRDKLKKLAPEEQRNMVAENFPKVEVIAYYKLWIIDLTANLNVRTSLTIPQIDFLAERLFSIYSWTDKDLLLFFRNIRSGIYGQFFENLSPEKILEWAEVYWSDRIAVGETISSSDKPFSVTKDKMDPKVFKEMFKDVKKKDDTPPVMEKKSSTFFDSEKGFRAYLKNVSIVADEQQLMGLIESWKLTKKQNIYVDIFCEHLGKISDAYEPYTSRVLKVIELQNEFANFSDPELISQIDSLEVVINEFINQNKQS